MAKITTRLTKNLAKVREMLGAEPPPDLEWLVVLKDAEAVGLMAARQINLYESRVLCMVPQKHWEDKELVRGIRQGLEAFLHDGTIKLSMSFPESLPGALSLAMRLGFKREGTNRASFRDAEGKIIDQIHLGRTKED